VTPPRLADESRSLGWRASKVIALLSEAGVTPASYPTLNRRLPRYATPEWREKLSRACAARAVLGPASLVLYDVSTLYFETDRGDGLREPGFFKERRLEPQVTIRLLTDQAGFPLTACHLARIVLRCQQNSSEELR